MDDAIVVWDLPGDPDGNVRHVAENDLTLNEVEDVLLDSGSSDGVSRSSGRPMVYGWTSTGRHIAVVWEVVNEDPRMIRVRTAYEVQPRTRS